MLPGGLRVWVASAPVNMSRSIDGLVKIVVEQFAKDPRADGVFVFVNGKRDRVKLLWKDQSGWWLLYKRLDARLVIRPLAASPSSSPLVTIDGRTLAALLEGVARVQREKAKDVAKKSRDRAQEARGPAAARQSDGARGGPRRRPCAEGNSAVLTVFTGRIPATSKPSRTTSPASADEAAGVNDSAKHAKSLEHATVGIASRTSVPQELRLGDKPQSSFASSLVLFIMLSIAGMLLASRTGAAHPDHRVGIVVDVLR